MKIVTNMQQGSADWLQFRATRFGSSEAAAMLGLSKYTTRSELLRIKHTGLDREFGDWFQRNVLDKGHAVEAATRPLIESQIEDELYPVVCQGEGRLVASCDGVDLDGRLLWECKQWNEALAAEVEAGRVPDTHMPQCQHQLLVTGGERLLFTVSDGTGERLVSTEVLPHAGWLQRLLQGWAQFERDLANYVPPAVEPIEIVGRRPDQLPSLRSSVRGELVLESNIKEWEAAALTYIKSVRDHELKTDEDFANADEAAKWCDSSKQALLGVRANLMSATGDVNVAVATLDRIAAELDKTRIAFTNAIKTRKEARKEEMVRAAGRALIDHIAALNAELAPMALRPVAADFPGAIKGLRSIASMQDALDTTLAGAKIAADSQARGIRANIAHFAKTTEGMQFLFSDLSALVHKSPDDFEAVLASRIHKHLDIVEAQEKKRQADEAARIAAAEQRAREQEAARIAAEQEEQRRHDAAKLAIKARQEQAQAEELGRLMSESASAAAIADLRSTPPVVLTYGADVQRAAAGILQTIAPLLAQDECHPLSAALAGKPDAPMHAREAAQAIASKAAADEPATLTLGTICGRLGFTISGAFLGELHIRPAATDKRAQLYTEAQFQAICRQLAAHVGAMAELYAGETA